MTADLALPPMRPLGSARISRDPLDGHPAYGLLLADAPRTGACPVWLTHPEQLRVPDDPQQVVAAVGASDPAVFLAERWPRNCPLCGCRDPFGDVFPGLAATPRSLEEPVVVAVRVARERVTDSDRAHLAIVPVGRSADIPAALGWAGAVDPGERAGLSAVLRSWEERFGAVVVRIDETTLWIAVASPPGTEAECRGVAAEHSAFCRDVDGDDTPLRAYAKTLRGAATWRFRWY